ncbi:MAG: carboxypeptidase-like regulatory domain-containing protein [Emticicia sp.]|uniref:carboxypeptidase-like regulatory domain-containing protein n=1 Tax=Emticicia sp. TaxID=1930953 RepID=UPI003BA5E61A
MKNIILLLLISTSTYAQLKSIRGKVIDDKTKESLPYVNLFIGNTTKGTSTNDAGEFTFSNLPVGSYNVVASMVGYLSKSTPIVVKEENSVVEIVISLQHNEQILDEVSVKSSKDKVWDARLKRFKNIFLGISENAKYCKILNPYVIDFEEKDDKLFAKSSQPILIENLALGYKLTFVMKAFEVSKTDFLIAGDTFFEEMLASSKEQVTWRAKRLDAYQGSINHFLQSLARRTSTQDGFNVYAYLPNSNAKSTNSFVDNLVTLKTVEKVNPDSLISQKGSMTNLDLTKNIEIHYTQKNEFRGPYIDINYQISKFESKKNIVRYNQYGLFENPLDVFVIGSFSNHRVADLLPIDFQPKIEELIAKTAVTLDEKNYTHLQENIVFHTNKSNYYLGETIWFKTYLTYTKPAYQDAISRVVYVDLIDDEQKIIESKVLKIKNGVSNGDFLLKTQFKNGRYFLRAYTNWQRNFGDSTQTVHEITVLSKNQVIDSPITDYKEVSQNISLNKDKFNSTENVEITLEGIPNHSYSISVTNENAVKIYQPIVQKEFSKQKISLESIDYNSETGRTFFGKTKDSNGKPISADLMMMRKDTFLMDNFQSDKEGNFKVENINGKDTLVIDILANGKKGKPISNILLEEPPKPQFYQPKVYNTFKIIDKQPTNSSPSVNYDFDFDIKNSILLQEVNVKAKKPDTTMLLRFHKVFGKPSYEFTDKKYNFNGKLNFIQTIQGRVPGLIMKFDAATGIVGIGWSRGGPPPEIWVDGIRVNNINEVTATADMIARIDVHRQNRSIIAPNGIIAIYTKNFMAGSDLSLVNTPPAEGIKRFKMAGFSTPKKFYLPENELDDTKLFQLKNRSTIYWNPDIFTNNEGKAKVSFQAIGNPGKYRVEIVGYDENGKVTKSQKTFTID